MKKILLLCILSISLFSLSGCNETKQNKTDSQKIEKSLNTTNTTTKASIKKKMSTQNKTTPHI